MTRTRKSEYSVILTLAGPILAGQIGSIATGFADNIMVGRYSTEALASASFVNNLFNVAILACIGFTMGLTPLVGALFARGETSRTGALLRSAAVVNTVFALLTMAVMGVVYLCLDRLGQPAELLPLIRPYFLLALAGILPLTLFNVFEQWCFGTENTVAPMWIILGGNVLNVLGNWMLIYGVGGFPEMGLTGAGISTFVSRVAICVAIMWYFASSRRGRPYHAGFRRARLTGADVRLLTATSLPVALQMCFETAAFGISAIWVGELGTVPLAAYQIVVITGTLGFCIYYSAGAALSVRVANAAGAGDRAAMRSRAWAGYHIILAIMVLSSLTFIFGSRHIMSAFTDDPAVLGLALTLITPLVLYQLGDATQITFANALRGTAHVKPMLWISFFSYVVIGLPSTYMLCFNAALGVYGVVLSFSVSLFTAAALFLTFFLRATSRS